MTVSSLAPRSFAAPRGRTFSLWGLLLLQSFCALFFLADSVVDLLGTMHLPVGADHDLFEFLVVIALLLGIAFTSFEIRAVLHRQRRMEIQLQAASGAFAEVLEAHFEGWAPYPLGAGRCPPGDQGAHHCRDRRPAPNQGGHHQGSVQCHLPQGRSLGPATALESLHRGAHGRRLETIRRSAFPDSQLLASSLPPKRVPE